MKKKKEKENVQNKLGKQHFGIRKEFIGFLLLLPALASIVIFKYFPILLGVFETFFNMSIVELPGEFVGFDNYIRAFRDSQFLQSFLHNLKAFFYSLTMNFWVPIFLAILINEVRRGKTVFRMLYFIPACAPAIAMTVLWKFFWQPDYGLANYILSIFGLPAQMWLNSEQWVYFCIYFQGLVISGGMNMVIYLAALQDVPGELYEAALVDGAGIIHRIRYITLPGIKNVVVLMLTLAIISAFNVMENIMILTGGGPANSTQTMLLYAYQQATNSMDYSYAMTMTTIIFIVTMTLTIIFNRVTREKD